jgi:hypothetical protein
MSLTCSLRCLSAWTVLAWMDSASSKYAIISSSGYLPTSSTEIRYLAACCYNHGSTFYSMTSTWNLLVKNPVSARCL